MLPKIHKSEERKKKEKERIYSNNQYKSKGRPMVAGPINYTQIVHSCIYFFHPHWNITLIIKYTFENIFPKNQTNKNKNDKELVPFIYT